MLGHWTSANGARLDASRNASPRIITRIPQSIACTAQNCGWDEFSQSAKKSDCMTCLGTGRLTTWQAGYVRARILWTSAIQFSFFTPTPGVDLGDVLLTISPFDVATLQSILDTERAYIEVEGRAVRPTIIQALNTPGIGEEYQIVCHLYNPKQD